MEFDFIHTIHHYIMPLIIIIGSVMMFISIFTIRKIIYILNKEQNRLFWEITALVVIFFFTNYLVVAYLISRETFSMLMVVVTMMCFAGALFVYFILKNSLFTITELSIYITRLHNEIDTLQHVMDTLKLKTESLATANARMAQLYVDLEEVKAKLEIKEASLEKKNEEASKVNHALANANSNISHLYVELEEVKDQLMAKKLELQKKNKLLSKSNISLAHIFKRFVPEQYLDKIAKNGIETLNAGYAERVNLTVTFSDIRSFTSISEEKDERDILTLLNRYFSHMSQVIYRNSGFIDKFIGDSIMALFENASNYSSHATNAVNAAISMQMVLTQINSEIIDITKEPIRIGVGVHSGEVVLGTVGYEERMSSTVLGTTVNIASRIEHLTKEFGVGIIISKSSMDLLDDAHKYQYRDLGPNAIRGIQDKIQLYEIFDFANNDIRSLKQKTIPYFSKGADFMLAAEWEQAIKQYQAALEIYPNDTASKYLLKICRNHSNHK